jgi:hypothetical protein
MGAIGSTGESIDPTERDRRFARQTTLVTVAWLALFFLGTVVLLVTP